MRAEEAVGKVVGQAASLSTLVHKASRQVRSRQASSLSYDFPNSL